MESLIVLRNPIGSCSTLHLPSDVMNFSSPKSRRIFTKTVFIIWIRALDDDWLNVDVFAVAFPALQVNQNMNIAVANWLDFDTPYCKSLGPQLVSHCLEQTWLPHQYTKLPWAKTFPKPKSLLHCLNAD